MKVNLRMTRDTARANCLSKTKHSTKCKLSTMVNGRRACDMAMDLNVTVTETNTREISAMI